MVCTPSFNLRPIVTYVFIDFSGRLLNLFVQYLRTPVSHIKMFLVFIVWYSSMFGIVHVSLIKIVTMIARSVN